MNVVLDNPLLTAVLASFDGANFGTLAKIFAPAAVRHLIDSAPAWVSDIGFPSLGTDA